MYQPDHLEDWELEFAEKAVAYLAAHGLAPDAVARCLVDECGIDYETAIALAA
ncbi:MAG TPA: hypothetical protein VLB67_11395 [Acidimicrobiia bacterium]|nr:hypothetical protein [Acidimicrobiia bacterium]